jgi:quercetin dioxygenase-like cupin family protein
MPVNHVRNIEKTAVINPEAANAIKQVLIGPSDGWEDNVMRLFTLGPNGYSPRHTHPWPHINYVTQGTGNLFLDGNNHEMKVGSVAYIPPGKEHQFTNTGNTDFAFICIVPIEGEG